MNVLVIIFHPTIAESQLQQFLLAAAEGETNITLHQISSDIFEQRCQKDMMDRERELIEQADRIVLQFPVYWYSCPTEMKAWLDGVLEERWAHRIGSKQLGIVASFGVQATSFQAGKKEHYTVSEMCRPFEMIANSLGWEYLPIFPIHQFSYFTEEEKQQLLVDYLFYLTDQTGRTLMNCETWMIEYAKKFSVAKGEFIQKEAWQEIASWLTELHDERLELSAMLKEMDGE